MSALRTFLKAWREHLDMLVDMLLSVAEDDMAGGR